MWSSKRQKRPSGQVRSQELERLHKWLGRIVFDLGECTLRFNKLCATTWGICASIGGGISELRCDAIRCGKVLMEVGIFGTI